DELVRLVSAERSSGCVDERVRVPKGPGDHDGRGRVQPRGERAGGFVWPCAPLGSVLSARGAIYLYDLVGGRGVGHGWGQGRLGDPVAVAELGPVPPVRGGDAHPRARLLEGYVGDAVALSEAGQGRRPDRFVELGAVD